MMDQRFGHKELYEVVLRAKAPMQFGDRYIEAQEPILYFDNVNMTLLTEQNRPVFARGGWGNMPRVVWDERQEVQFQMIEGVMSSVGMGILLGSNVLSRQEDKPLYIHMKEELSSICKYDDKYPCIETRYPIAGLPDKKVFIFEYSRKAIQKKVYGRFVDVEDNYGINHHCIALALDKKFEHPAENDRKYVIDYYYNYEHEAITYLLEKERFNGLFTLEAKFYSKDENEGRKYTNVMFMPKVRIVSNINLRLGERADPTVSTFNIIGMPETVGEYKNLIVDITRLDDDIDADI